MILIGFYSISLIFLQHHPDALIQFHMKIISRRKKWHLDTAAQQQLEKQVGIIFFKFRKLILFSKIEKEV